MSTFFCKKYKNIYRSLWTISGLLKIFLLSSLYLASISIRFYVCSNENLDCLILMARPWQLSLELMTSIKCIPNELNLIPDFHSKYQDVEGKKKKSEKDLVDTDIKVVEIKWNGRIARISFPKPKDADYLTEKTKSEFTLHANLSTAEKRMKHLLNEAPVFMAEMQQIHILSQLSSTYGLIHKK